MADDADDDIVEDDDDSDDLVPCAPAVAAPQLLQAVNASAGLNATNGLNATANFPTPGLPCLTKKKKKGKR